MTTTKNTEALPAETREAMALAALRIKETDPARWNAFVQAVAGELYDRIHAACAPGCVCEEGRSGIRTGKPA